MHLFTFAIKEMLDKYLTTRRWMQSNLPSCSFLNMQLRERPRKLFASCAEGRPGGLSRGTLVIAVHGKKINLVSQFIYPSIWPRMSKISSALEVHSAHIKARGKTRKEGVADVYPEERSARLEEGRASARSQRRKGKKERE